MARYDFAGTSGDFVYVQTSADLMQLQPATVTIYDAEVGGSQVTDLMLDGVPVTTIPVGNDGQTPSFQGPDGVGELWGDAGLGRRRMVGHLDPSTVVTTTIGDASYLSTTAPALLAAGRMWGFAGDSITAGTGAAAGRRFINLAPWMVGTAYVAPVTPLTPATGAVYSVDGGVGGERSDQILTRVPGIIAQGVDGLALLAGTNDANQSVTVTTFMSNIAAIATLCRQAGIPLIVGLVPPRSSGTSTAIRTLIAAYNLALREWAPRNGVYLANSHAPLAVITDSTLAAAYDSGDGIHPNTNGHRLIAAAFASEMVRAVLPRPHLVSTKTPLSLGRNQIFDATSLETNWSEQPGGTGTPGTTYSRVADTTGKLPTGAFWEQMDFDATTTGGTRHRTTSLNAAAAWAVGDQLLITWEMELEDVSGFTTAANADPNTANVQVRIINGSTGSQITSGTYIPTLSQSPGRSATMFSVPVGVTSMVLWVTVVLPTGARAKVRFSAIDVLNMTTAGLAGTY